MTGSQDTDPENDLPFERRDLLKIAGAAGAIGAFGSETAAAQPPHDLIVGTTHGRADVATQKASSMKHTMDFGPAIGEAVAGRWSEKARRGLENNPHVRYIEEDTPGERHEHILPWGVDRIDAEVAHAKSDTGRGVDVAIIDSGIDSDHDDLADNLGTGHAPAKCSDCCSGCDEEWEDTDGHGTSVAGIVGAIDNSIDVVGVAPDVTLHAIKDGDAAPNSSETAKGLEIAADEGYDIANISSSVGSASGSVGDAVEYAANNGVVIVASAGNGGPCTDCVSYPASDSRTIAVSNITRTDTLANTSNQGPEIDIAAPGTGATTTANGGGTTSFGGTSAAAPHVSGAAAVLIATGTDPSDVRSVLKNDAEDIGLGSNRQGAGLLDLANTLGHDSANDLTEVETQVAADVQYTEAELNGEVTELTGNDTVDVFFEYREAGSGTWTTTPAETQTGTGSYEKTITGLEEATSYEFRAAATVFELDEGWSSTERGDIRDFGTVDNPDPIASFTQDPAVPNPDQTVTFDASRSDPGEAFGVSENDSISTYEWDFADDGTFDDTGETVTYSYPDSGDVTVRLRVTDEFDQTDETTRTFRVNAHPEAAFQWTPSLPDEGDDITFDAFDSFDPDGTIEKYEWEFGDGTTETTSDPTIDHNYGDAGEDNWGEFEVTLTVTDTDDGSDTVTQTVRVNAYPIGEAFTVTPSSPNEGDEIEFKPSDSFDPDGTIDEYLWDFGDGETETGEVVTYRYGDAGEGNWGEFDVSLTVTDDDGASHEDLSVHEQAVRVNAYPRADFEVKVGGELMDPLENPVVRGEPVEFDASDSTDPDGTIDEYEWDFGDGNTGTGEVVTHTYDEGGEMSVTLTVTDNDGASHENLSADESTFTVTIRVTVEIKPNDANDINPRRPGEVPVAVHHTADFDPPSELDPATVRFGVRDVVNVGNGAEPAHVGGHIDDVNNDGNDDWLCHFSVRDTGFESDDDEGKLVGKTTDDEPIPVFGFDDVNTVGRRS